MAALSCKKHCRTEMTQESCKGRLFTNRELWRLMCPLVIELLLTLLVGMIDSIMVSSVGEAAVSGVSLVDTVMQLLIYLFAALGTGGAVVAGQYLGSGNQKDACKSSEQLIGFSAVFSLAVMVVLIILKDIILNRLFGEITPEVRKYADTYLTITAFSIPAIAVYEAGAATFRAMSNSKITMWISLMMNMINVTGNAIFIYGAGMATGGAAVSTLLSRVAAAVVVTILLFNEQQELHMVLVYKCGQEKLNNLYYQVKEQRRCSTWRKTKNPTPRNSSSRSWICTMPEELRIHNWNVNMA